MDVQFLNRNIFQRIFGVPATSKPANSDCWRFSDGQLTIDLTKAPELKTSGGAIRLEGGDLPLRVLVTAGDDGEYRAYHNRCTHVGHRRLDPLPGSGVQCCSVSKSTYDADGNKIYGPAPEPIKTFSTAVDGDQLTIAID